MRAIAKFRKAPGDTRRYEVNYADWMNEGEVIEQATVTGTVLDDHFYVESTDITADGKEVVFYVSGGISGFSYDVTVQIGTSMSQIKNDVITFVVT